MAVVIPSAILLLAELVGIQEMEGLTPRPLRSNFGQVVHTYVPMSTSRITWYWPNGGDAVWLRR